MPRARLRGTLALAAGLAVVLAAGGSGAPVEAGTIQRQPQLQLVRANPVAVRGTGFRSREPVRVLLREASGALWTRHVRASRRGTLSATFPVAVNRCTGFSITARGRSGSRATLRRVPLPACSPP